MTSWLQQQVAKHPDKIAFYWQEEQWTFAEINTEVQKWLRMYDTVLPKKEKRVALFSQNSKDMYFTILALWELGKELVLLNTHLTQEELDYQLKDANVSQVIVSADKLDFFKQVQTVSMSLDSKEMVQKNAAVEPYSLKSVASIMYTSGTTGKPKGVLQLFENHLASALATQENMAVTETDCWLCAVPLFHISGLSIILRQLVLGCSVRLYEKFDAQQVTNALILGKGTIASVVTVMLEELLTLYPKEGYAPDFRTLLLGGGPVSLATLNQCKNLNIPIIQSYGMTETCSQVVALSSADSLEKIGSAGKPLAGVALKIVKAEKQLFAPNEVGEVLLRGGNVVRHYIGSESRNSDKWTADGWFRTGDLGYLDQDGYLYLVSRLSELIISGGENIYPTEVEQALQKISGVKEVAVIGEPDEKWGAVPVAYIVRKNNLTTTEIQQKASQYLAKYKRPKKVYFCHSLPRTANGKLAKHRLTTVERTAFLEQ